MKKFLYITIGIAVIVVLGFIIPPPDGFWGGDGEVASVSETELVIPSEPIPPALPRYSWDILSRNQVKDEFIEKKQGFTPTGLLYSELLDPKIAQTVVSKAETDYVSDSGKAVSVKTKFEDTNLEWINVGTLYVRAKKDGNLTDRTLTAKLIDGTGKELISVDFTREELELGWITKWASMAGV